MLHVGAQSSFEQLINTAGSVSLIVVNAGCLYLGNCVASDCLLLAFSHIYLNV